MTEMKSPTWGAISTFVGGCAGTLLYTGLLSEAQVFDWPRSLFVGAFVGIATWITMRIKSKK